MPKEVCRICILQECSQVTPEIKLRRFVGGMAGFVENENINDCPVKKNPDSPESKGRINLLQLKDFTPPHLKDVA